MAIKAIHINNANNPIFAQDDAAWIEGIVGAEGILKWRSNLEVSKIDNNTVRLQDGAFITQGRVIRVDGSEDLTVTSGSIGLSRIDLIIAQVLIGSPDVYNIVIKQGDPHDTAPEAPELVVQDLYSGGTKREVEIGRIKITDSDITSVEITAPIIDNVNAVVEKLSGLEDRIDTIEANNSLQAGQLDSGALEPNVTRRVTVVFPTPFTSKPSVSVTLNGLAVNQIDLGVAGVTVSQFDIVIRSNAVFSTVPIQWIAARRNT